MNVPALRPYQLEAKHNVYRAWHNGARNVALVSPTGSGKTVLFGSILHETQGASVAIAHRQELVTQISLALARVGVRHGLIAPDSVARLCVSLHMAEVGRSYYDPRAACRVAGVDTLVRRDTADPWFQQVRLWVQDEGHHVLAANKWGTAAGLFPNAYGLGVTATPLRADGRGLGRHADGLYDAMVEGPSMRSLIEAGYLSDYRVFCPPSDVNYAGVDITASGDYSLPKLRAAVHRSNRIVGDIVGHYVRLANGKLGITFAVDVEAATEIAAEYRRQGVPAEVVTAKTPDHLRIAILRRFRAREVLQLVNVDLFGEGFDVPACKVVSMARKTESLGLYRQQFGRALRPDGTDERAIIIDHVGNVTRHGLPDAPYPWTLDRRERASRGKADTLPCRVCPQCTGYYEGHARTCPYCGAYAEPTARSDPQYVDGVLSELEPAALAKLRGEIARVDGMPVLPYGASDAAQRGAFNQHHARQAAQIELRAAMGLFGGFHKHHQGRDDDEIQARFYRAFGVDVLSAMSLGKPDAEALRERINEALRREGVQV